ncbi:MAG: NUDIX hydrolase [Alcanivorax sp.]|nr:NUDIX hydrolase [Alcanivorax sp.]
MLNIGHESVLLVVAAIIRHPDNGRILLSQRPAHKHKGGCWEFPGGKVEPDEALDAALARELHEELGLTVRECRPFMTIDHAYPELSVRLCFREVTAFEGEPHGREGQPVDWFTADALADLPFPEANQPVVTALGLPDQLLVLPDTLSCTPPDDWQKRLADAVAAGCRLVYLRGDHDRATLASLARVAQAAGARVLVADNVALARDTGADGVHLRSGLTDAQIAQVIKEGGDSLLYSMACHDEAELERARRAGVDLVMLSPVHATPTHPDAAGLGWERFRTLAEGQPFSVYALGGVGPQDLDVAREHGARGVAGIRAFW